MKANLIIFNLINKQIFIEYLVIKLLNNYVLGLINLVAFNLPFLCKSIS